MEIQSVPPPGQFIREELEAREWTQRDLAYILDTPEQAVNVIISGKRGISPEMAKAFGKAFDVPPEFFLNLQKAYDLSRAREPDPGIEKRATLQAVYPIREMIRRGWLEDSDAAMLEVQVIRFFGQNRLEDIPHLAHAAKEPFTRCRRDPTTRGDRHDSSSNSGGGHDDCRRSRVRLGV